MFQKILQKGADWLNKRNSRTSVDETKYEEKDEKILKGDSIKLKKQIFNLICEDLNNYKFGKSLQIHSITLFIQGSDRDDVMWSMVATSEFEDELRLYLSNKSIYAASNETCKWIFRCEKPLNKGAKELVKGIYLMKNNKEEQSQESHTELFKARVTALNGTLEQDSYIINVEQQQKWNIGRGKEPLRDGRKHHNDIIIKEDEYNPQKNEINRKVSGKHAYIVFIPKEGFKLRAYTRLDSYGRKELTSTQIERDDTQSSRVLIDEKQEFLLQNGDQIILASSVILLFEFFKNEMNEVSSSESKVLTENDNKLK